MGLDKIIIAGALTAGTAFAAAGQPVDGSASSVPLRKPIIAGAFAPSQAMDDANKVTRDDPANAAFTPAHLRTLTSERLSLQMMYGQLDASKFTQREIAEIGNNAASMVSKNKREANYALGQLSAEKFTPTDSLNYKLGALGNNGPIDKIVGDAMSKVQARGMGLTAIEQYETVTALNATETRLTAAIKQNSEIAPKVAMEGPASPAAVGGPEREQQKLARVLYALPVRELDAALHNPAITPPGMTSKDIRQVYELYRGLAQEQGDRERRDGAKGPFRASMAGAREEQREQIMQRLIPAAASAPSGP